MKPFGVSSLTVLAFCALLQPMKGGEAVVEPVQQSTAVALALDEAVQRALLADERLAVSTRESSWTVMAAGRRDIWDGGQRLITQRQHTLARYQLEVARRNLEAVAGSLGRNIIVQPERTAKLRR